MTIYRRKMESDTSPVQWILEIRRGESPRTQGIDFALWLTENNVDADIWWRLNKLEGFAYNPDVWGVVLPADGSWLADNGVLIRIPLVPAP